MTLQNRPPNECLLIIVTLTSDQEDLLYFQGDDATTTTSMQARERRGHSGAWRNEEKLIFAGKLLTSR